MAYDTKLSPPEEAAFSKWKSRFAPKDSGQDYDLRGAFKAGLTPNPDTGHWPDTFKKPNHPTFSDQSIYAKQAPERAGRWQGDTFIPPAGGTMANYDDALTAAQKRALRTGRSFFPAANVQGQIIQGSGAGNAGYGIGNGVLPPDQNPAYQAALLRPKSGGLTMINSPTGGSMGVTAGQLQKYLNKGYTLSNQPLNPVASAALQPSSIPGAGGKSIAFMSGYLGGQGGALSSVTAPSNAVVAPRTPVDTSWYNTPAAMAIRGAIPSNQQYAANLGAGLPNFSQIGQQLGGLYRGIASWFGGGNLPSVPATANAAQPSPTPYQTPFPSATPTPTPFKTSDARSDLLRDTEGTFYGGGQVPIPTPTPTPYVPRLAYGPPRRYSDDFGYNSYA